MLTTQRDLLPKIKHRKLGHTSVAGHPSPTPRMGPRSSVPSVHGRTGNLPYRAPTNAVIVLGLSMAASLQKGHRRTFCTGCDLPTFLSGDRDTQSWSVSLCSATSPLCINGPISSTDHPSAGITSVYHHAKPER